MSNLSTDTLDLCYMCLHVDNLMVCKEKGNYTGICGKADVEIDLGDFFTEQILLI